LIRIEGFAGAFHLLEGKGSSDSSGNQSSGSRDGGSAVVAVGDSRGRKASSRVAIIQGSINSSGRSGRDSELSEETTANDWVEASDRNKAAGGIRVGVAARAGRSIGEGDGNNVADGGTITFGVSGARTDIHSDV